MTDSSAQSGTPLVSRLLSWRPRETWHVVLASGVSVLLAGVVTIVIADKNLASAQTYVSSATHADIKLADGRQRPATEGALVPRGASVLTDRSGGARLTTEGRDVYVGALSTVQVVDGLHQVLQRGLVMIDTRKGPGLTMATANGAGTITAGQSAIARVEQNVGTLRLATYQGAASITADGRRATTTVPALYQVRVPYFGVPEPRTALALTVSNGSYDTWEQRLAADLVQADIDLNSFAAGLNGSDGLTVLNAAPVSLRDAVLQSRTRGEQALAVAVAQKGRLHRDPRANLEEVERDRADGGSWGVVAAIVSAPVTDVTGVLGSSLNDPGTPVTLAGGPPASGSPTAGATGTSSSGTRPTPRPTRPTKTPGGRRPTTPPPTPDPIKDAIKQVTDAVPTPTPTPPAPTVPPTPSGPLSSLIGALLKPLLP